MSYLNCYTVESVAVAPDRHYGRFVLGQFAPGQGLTVANSLRRGLLTELTGCTFAFVYIPGARYEYESLPGLKETVLDILLNLKRVRLNSGLKVHPPIVSDLTIVGPKAVTGRDLNLPPFVTVVNPDQPIVTVTETRTLVMRLVVVFGKGRDRNLSHDGRYRDYVQLIHSEQGRKRWMRDVDSGLVSQATPLADATCPGGNAPPADAVRVVDGYTAKAGGADVKTSQSPEHKKRRGRKNTRRAVTAWRRATDEERRAYDVDRIHRSRRSVRTAFVEARRDARTKAYGAVIVPAKAKAVPAKAKAVPAKAKAVPAKAKRVSVRVGRRPKRAGALARAKKRALHRCREASIALKQATRYYNLRVLQRRLSPDLPKPDHDVVRAAYRFYLRAQYRWQRVRQEDRRKIRVTVPLTPKRGLPRVSTRTGPSTRRHQPRNLRVETRGQKRRVSRRRVSRSATAKPALRRKPPKRPSDRGRSGYFPLHGDVGPVTAVNYTIEAPTDNGERIGLEIWTDGSTEPARALGHAVRATIQLFLPLQRRPAVAVARVSSDRDRYRRRLKLTAGRLRLGAGVVRRRGVAWNRGFYLRDHRLVKQNRLQTLRTVAEFGDRYGVEARRTAKHNAVRRTATSHDRRVDRTVVRKRRRWAYDHHRRLQSLARAVKRGYDVFKRPVHRYTYQPRPRRRDCKIRERRYLYASRLVHRWRRARRVPPSLATHVSNLALSARTARALTYVGLTDVSQLFVPDSVLQARYALPANVVASVITSLIRHVAAMILNHRDRPDATTPRSVPRRGMTQRTFDLIMGQDSTSKAVQVRGRRRRRRFKPRAKPVPGPTGRGATTKVDVTSRQKQVWDGRQRRVLRSVPRDDGRYHYLETLKSLLVFA